MNIINSTLMQKEQDPLGLSALPPIEPPDDDWPIIQQALVQRKRHQRMQRGAGLLAAAAVITLAIGLNLNFKPPDAEPVLEQPVAEQDILNSLVSLSQQLESQISTHRSRIGATSSQNLVYQVELEDLVAMVDEELSRDPQSLELWSQRVNLLLDINQIYKNQLRRDYHKMASN